MFQSRTNPPKLNLAIEHFGKTFLGESAGDRVAFYQANGNGKFHRIGSGFFVERVGLVDLSADLPKSVRHKFEEALLQN